MNEKVIFIGTDDGLIQVTENEGQSWKKIEVSALGVPARSYVNDIKADLFDESTMYVALDNHKEGDFKPYLLKSTDNGSSWTRIDNGLGEKNLVWRIVQDHVDKDLMFAATEFGVYVTFDGGGSWTKLKSGIPTISFRDLAIQRRENDLVAASFGRGFYILDDYSALRNISREQLDAEAVLFEPRKAWWYIERSIMDFENARGSQGTQLYLAPNPDFGAVFTYYLKDGIESLKKERQTGEKDVTGNIPFPGWAALEDETREIEPFIYIEIRDQEGHLINRLKAENKKGFNRVAWNLRVGGNAALTLEGDQDEIQGLLCAPGTYTATLNKYEKGKFTQLAGPVNVLVEPMMKGTLEGSPMEEVVAFWRTYEEMNRDLGALGISLQNEQKKIDKIGMAALKADVDNALLEEIEQVRDQLNELDSEFNGNAAKNQIGERNKPLLSERAFALSRGITTSTYGPTETHKQTMKIITDQMNAMEGRLNSIKARVREISEKVVAAGGSRVEGMD
ncbi:WD40/YVTN/BNR-like repeat-containing protein [Fulvivirga sedimenti]|uniref:Glycosyl hydrolase n=1 Tax=Fulvivirga sedimenti TaxID=2879465 RepID=A0A9X1HR96_9BACT|nr:hypothetical protein [Fulvivirga sedimenti]MCA6074767.1 hypothetical protein [Fulvivirga sedimenti]MCA6075944.1 hypothetical protein [Fulvivirga sedimenti]MCA6077072.1 hypothetical protein [Fulvivirga sedimenti]